MRYTLEQAIQARSCRVNLYGIPLAGKLLMSISQDERERAIFRSRRMAQTDMDSNIATAEERGERRGMEKEREKWQGMVADKDAEIARLRAELGRK